MELLPQIAIYVKQKNKNITLIRSFSLDTLEIDYQSYLIL